MARKEATIILLDVGENTQVHSTNDATFFDRAKACVSKIIQKKIFAKPNDEIGVVLMGTDDTNNDLNKSLEGFQNVTEFIPLQLPNWDMIRMVDKIEVCDAPSDWVDGLVVALNFAKLGTQAKKFANVRILVITNFIADIDDSNMDIIVNNLTEANFELLAISDCVEHTENIKTSQFTQTASQASTQTKSQKVFTNIIEQTGGQLCHIDLAESQLLTIQKKKTRAVPWNTTLTIGSDLKIAVSGYVKVQEEKFLAPFKTTHIDIENTATKMITEYTKNNQPIAKPDEDDTIKAYMYGSTMVALNEDVSCKATEKGLVCLGFPKRENLLDEDYSGDGCHIVLPQKNHPKSATLFTALVHGMHKGRTVMIARKVYRNGVSPITVVLIPCLSDNKPSLTMIQLPFLNDMNMFAFPKLRNKKNNPSPEQEKVVEDLVRAMDLMDVVDDDSGLTEAFLLETTLNPVNQHLLRTVAFRALNPSEPLPNIDPELAAMIEIPSKVQQRSESIVTEIEKLFPFELVERPTKRVFGQSNKDANLASDAMDDIDASVEDADVKNIVAVGTVSPVEDFGYLLKKGERFGKLAEQIQTVIYDLIFRTTAIQKEKILECIMMYREQSKIYAPFNYNKWLKDMKDVIVQKNRLDFWQDSIVKEGFGLITNKEAQISTVTVKEQQEFYEIAVKETNRNTSIVNESDDDLDAYMD